MTQATYSARMVHGTPCVFHGDTQLSADDIASLLNKSVLLSDIGLMRHAVGASSNVRRNQWGFRNYFCAGGKDNDACERLTVLGYMHVLGKPSEITGGDQSYFVTKSGCELIGLTPAQQKRALKGD